MASYRLNTAEQFFLQTMMAVQCCDEDKAKALVISSKKAAEMTSDQASTSSASQSDVNVNAFVSRINGVIKHFLMSISRGHSESDGRLYYMLINTVDSKITRSSTVCEPNELRYFQNIILAILSEENCEISMIQAINTTHTGITNSGAEALIKKWEDNLWLEEVNNRKLVLGVRCLVEMSIYLKNQYQVDNCFRCKMICVRGPNCSSCRIKLHFRCFDGEFVPNNKCPACGGVWEGENGPSITSPTRSSKSSSSKKTNSRTIFSSSEDTEGEEEVQMTSQASQSRPKRTRKS